MTDLTFALAALTAIFYGPVAFNALRREVAIRRAHYAR